jgi:four helix bundle protein
MGDIMRDFQTLEAWKKGHKLVLSLYKATAEFPKEEQYGLTSQIRRAGVSVPTNIAEGCGHQSESEFARYLQLAAASATELQYHIILARDLSYLEPERYTELSRAVEEIKKMLTTFIKRVRARI